MMSMLSDELILLIGGNCSNNDICNLSQTSKNIAKLRLYRLCISNIFCYRFLGNCSYLMLKYEFINNIQYYKNSYSFCDYIQDVYFFLFNTECINNNINIKKIYYNLQYKQSYNIVRILRNRFTLTKDNCYKKYELYEGKFFHNVYRISAFVYRNIKKMDNGGLLILALNDIYI